MNLYSVVRCKREDSNAPCTNKNRTKDSCLTEAVKVVVGAGREGGGEGGGWNSCAHFRFPLPESVNSELHSFDANRERLFRGPPMSVKMGVYEKRM